MKVFSLIKRGERNAWDPGDYRKISIVPTFGKFFEKVIYHRLQLECGDRIHDSQGGGVLEIVLCSKSSG